MIFQIQSTLIVLLLFWGASQARKNKHKHAKIMGVAIAWDIFLILQIELSRSAIATAMKTPENELILNIHIFLAVSTVFLYTLTARSGYRLLTAVEQNKKKHKTLGVITLLFRVLTYITSFFAV